MYRMHGAAIAGITLVASTACDYSSSDTDDGSGDQGIQVAPTASAETSGTLGVGSTSGAPSSEDANSSSGAAGGTEVEDGSSATATLPPSCGNGVLETGESCDPASTCPSNCDDANACTDDSLSGAPDTCDVVCVNAIKTACEAGDGCCPQGCSAETDSDCSASCGDGVVADNETCDPASTCPTACDDGDACTNDQLTGSADNCNATCTNTPITTCVSGDGCCPSACTSVADSDCAPGSDPDDSTAGGDDQVATDEDATTDDTAAPDMADPVASGGDGGQSTTEDPETGDEPVSMGGAGGESTDEPPGDGEEPVTTPEGPCDIYEAAETPCVGAWSTTRALYSGYSGPLYQVRRTSDNATVDIPQLPGGIADASRQDEFCPGACTISKLYDQSPRGNDLAASGPVWHLPNGAEEADAKMLRTTLGGHPVYGLQFREAAPDLGDYGTSYRNHNPTGTAMGDQAEMLYEVVDTRIYNGLCCNSFGNAETTGNPDGPKTMEAIYFGDCPFFGNGSGNGPWVLADLEAGTFPSSQQWDDNIPSLNIPAYATLMLKGYQGDRFVLEHGNAQEGPLTTQWDGSRPTIEFEGEVVHYSPMEKQGAIVLGSGGDGSTWSEGSFFEGAMTIGVTDDESVDQAIQATIVAAGYGR